MRSPSGFIGPGNMGSGMAQNLIKATYTVYGLDIDQHKVKELLASGLRAVLIRPESRLP